MADMQTKTKIVFAGGAEVIVAQDASSVRGLLSRDKLEHKEPFTHFKTERDDDVYVAVEGVAYIEQVPEYGSAGFS